MPPRTRTTTTPAAAAAPYMLREATIRWNASPAPLQRVAGPADLYPIAASILPADDPREHFAAIALNTRHEYIGHQIISIGTPDAALIHPAVVLRFAVLACANALVVTHSHPSGHATPSADDITLTRRLVDAGHLLGIPIVDHLIIGNAPGEMRRPWISLREIAPHTFAA